VSAPAVTFPHPRPGLTHDNRFFWEGVAQRKLLVQRCAGCRRLQHPPAPMCPSCHGFAEGVRQVRGSAVNQVGGVEHVLVTAGTGVPTSAVILGRA